MTARRVQSTVLGLLCAALAAQVWLLDTRVAALQAQIDARPPGPGPRSPAPGAGLPRETPAGVSPPRGLADSGDVQRLARQVSRLREDLASLRRAQVGTPTRDDVEAAAGEDRILSVVEARNQRVIDTQLRFHRERWIRMRQQALRRFARVQRLDPDQSAELTQALGREVDEMIALLREPEVLEDPRRAAARWSEVLARTDAEAEGVLDATQHAQWLEARRAEREALWPWLDEPPGAEEGATP